MDFSDSPILVSRSCFSFSFPASSRKILVMLVSSFAEVSTTPTMCLLLAKLLASSGVTCRLDALLLAMSTLVPISNIREFEPVGMKKQDLDNEFATNNTSRHSSGQSSLLYRFYDSLDWTATGMFKFFWLATKFFGFFVFLPSLICESSFVTYTNFQLVYAFIKRPASLWECISRRPGLWAPGHYKLHICCSVPLCKF